MITDYDRLLRLTLELEGILTLRVNRRDTIDATNAARLDEMIDHLLAELGNSRPAKVTEEKEELSTEKPETEQSEKLEQSKPSEPSKTIEIPELSDNSDNSDNSNDSESSDNSDPSDNSLIAEAAIEEEAADADTPSTIGELSPSMSLNDRLAREKAADLSGAFSLNDRFRFRRELFRGSQQEMDEAIEALSQMSTAEEAREYIYDDLCLDPADDNVKAFMEIITNHF